MIAIALHFFLKDVACVISDVIPNTRTEDPNSVLENQGVAVLGLSWQVLCEQGRPGRGPRPGKGLGVAGTLRERIPR